MAIQSQPSRIPEPFAGSGTKNTIPATNTTPSASQAASWASGFPPECSQPISAGGCPVPRNDVNGALNQLSQDFAFRQDGGVWGWSALADYDVNRMVLGSNGLLYWSVTQNGPGFASGSVDPTTDDGTYWILLPKLTDIEPVFVRKNDWSIFEFIKGRKTFGNAINVFDVDNFAEGVAPASDYFKQVNFYAWNSSSLMGQDPDPYDETNWWRYGGVEWALRSDGIVDGKFMISTNPIGSGQTSSWHFISLEGNPADDYIRFRPNGNGEMLLGSGANRWKQVYAASSSINTSDARLKTEPENVPDAVLDAWGEVQFCQFQMLDAVREKGAKSARIHNGLIAQRIDEAFKSHGLDASRYGLFCFDSWEAKPESRDKDGVVHEPAEPAGDMYSLRYEEALCMEAAYQRRRADRAEVRIAALEERLAAIEANLNA